MSDEILIEKGIPMPAKNKFKSALMRMNNGDSFKVVTNNERRTVLFHALKMQIKVKTAKTDGTGFRIWKV